jgi:hypothetical protein
VGSGYKYHKVLKSDMKHSKDILQEIILRENKGILEFNVYELSGNDTKTFVGYHQFPVEAGKKYVLEYSDGIAVKLAPEYESRAYDAGFSMQDASFSYQCPVTGGHISLNFLSDGSAVASLMKQAGPGMWKGTAWENFSSYDDAIHWASTTKEFTGIGGKAPDKPKKLPKSKIKPGVTAPEIGDLLGKKLGFKYEHEFTDGKGEPTVQFISADKSKDINVGLSGKVHYNWQYIAFPDTGEISWGTTDFPTWQDFVTFVTKKTIVKPTKKVNPKYPILDYTPFPQDKKLRSVKKPMPWSGYDYAEWGKKSGYPPKSTIQLMSGDKKIIEEMGWYVATDQNNAYYYHNKDNDRVFFFVDGTAKFIHHTWKPPQEHNFESIKSLMEFLWSGYQAKLDPVKPKEIPKSPTAVSDMPYSGTDYAALGKHEKLESYHTRHLVPSDDAVMKKMGFASMFTPPIKTGHYWYQKVGEAVVARFFGSGTAEVSDPIPKTFNTVKEAMEYLWNKYKQTPVKENLYKEIMSVLCQ